MRLFIQHIEGNKSIDFIKNILKDLGLKHFPDITLGELTFSSFPDKTKLKKFKDIAEEKGYEFIYDRRKIIVEKTKLVVHELLSGATPPRENYSVYISKKLFLSYAYLANIFSQVEGITVEHYIIEKKIERAKQLLITTDMTIGEISAELNYSSIGHFSNQFKKVTGINPTDYKKEYFGNTLLEVNNK